jgi:hypothetical protein
MMSLYSNNDHPDWITIGPRAYETLEEPLIGLWAV